MNIDKKVQQDFINLGLHIKKLREGKEISLKELSEKQEYEKNICKK